MKVLMTSVDLLCWKSYDQSQINSGKKNLLLVTQADGIEALGDLWSCCSPDDEFFQKNLLIGQNM